MQKHFTQRNNRTINTLSSNTLDKVKQVNRGGGYGLEIPRECTFEGDSFSITWLKNKPIKEEFLAKE